MKFYQQTKQQIKTKLQQKQNQKIWKLISLDTSVTSCFSHVLFCLRWLKLAGNPSILYILWENTDYSSSLLDQFSLRNDPLEAIMCEICCLEGMLYLSKNQQQHIAPLFPLSTPLNKGIWLMNYILFSDNLSALKSKNGDKKVWFLNCGLWKF